MNELQEKLSKRRSVVEECGLNYESVPSQHREATLASTPATPLKTGVTFFSRAPSSGADFQAAIDRRRATVDGDGQTFESTPTVKTADAAATSTPSNASPAGIRPCHGTVDFKKRIDQQRASIDGGAQTFESSPAEHRADAGIAVPSPSRSAGQVFESTPEKTTADCVSSIRSETMQKPPELQLPASSALDLGEEDDAEAESIHEDDEGGDSQPSPTNSIAKEVPKTTLTVSGARVSWLVGLAHPLEEAFESDPFAIHHGQSVHLRLRVEGQHCHLELQGPDTASGATEVKLFVGKGWKKKAFRTWNLSSTLSEEFDTDLTNRNSILCGVIFKDKGINAKPIRDE